jgi:hypothetical protein
MEAIEPELNLSKSHLVFAPHHGRLEGFQRQFWIESNRK